MQTPTKSKKNTRMMCLSVSEQNRELLPLIDELSREYHLSKSQTIFRIVNEFFQGRDQG